MINAADDVARVTVHNPVHLNLYHASTILTGLHDMAARKEIHLDYSNAGFGNISGLTVMLRIERPLFPVIAAAIDLRDQTDIIDQAALDVCSIYFKRSYDPTCCESLPQILQAKVTPFGLNYACLGPRSRLTFLRAIAARLPGICAGKQGVKRDTLNGIVNDLKLLLTLPSPEDFEVSEQEQLEPAVFFQTRVWPPEETTEDLVSINCERVALVRAFKEAFGKQYIGGLVPEPFAVAHYPDLLTSYPTRRRDYARTMRRGVVGVYSRGLHGSAAFKLPEYLAAGKCIVAAPFDIQLPHPLVENRHYVTYSTPEECVEQCSLLLRDPAVAGNMRRENREYYRKWVQPMTHMRNTITRACQS